jgi:hypothetical protein
VHTLFAFVTLPAEPGLSVGSYPVALGFYGFRALNLRGSRKSFVVLVYCHRKSVVAVYYATDAVIC